MSSPSRIDDSKFGEDRPNLEDILLDTELCDLSRPWFTDPYPYDPRPLLDGGFSASSYQADPPSFLSQGTSVQGTPGSHSMKPVATRPRTKKTRRSDFPPFPQYNVLLASPHYNYRTSANDIWDNEVLPMFQRGNMKLEEVSIAKAILHEKLKVRLGYENIPEPTFWAPSNCKKGKIPVGSFIGSDTVSVSVGKHQKCLDVREVSEEFILLDNANKKRPCKDERLDVSQSSTAHASSSDVISSVENDNAIFEEAAESAEEKGRRFAMADPINAVCFGWFQLNLCKLREFWFWANNSLYNDWSGADFTRDQHRKHLTIVYNLSKIAITK